MNSSVIRFSYDIIIRTNILISAISTRSVLAFPFIVHLLNVEKHCENYQNIRSIAVKTMDVITNREVLAIAMSSLGIAFYSRTRHTYFYEQLVTESICLILRTKRNAEERSAMSSRDRK